MSFSQARICSAAHAFAPDPRGGHALHAGALLYKTHMHCTVMDFDEGLIKTVADSDPSWLLRVQDRQFVPESVRIAKAAVPVKKPGMRGGVYFSEAAAYKVQCSVGDRSIEDLLTSTMLGPSTDFTPLELEASAAEFRVLIRANLTGYVQTRGGVLLNLTVTDVTG